MSERKNSKAGKPKISFEQKKRANTGCLRGVLYMLFITGTAFFLAVFGWNCANDVLALRKSGDEVTIIIPKNFTIEDISRDLASEKIIDRAWLFTMFCKFSKAEEKIEPGEYLVDPSLDYNAIVKRFVNRPVREEVLVVIPEGKTLHETLTILSEAGVAPLEDLLRSAGEDEFTQSFLEGVPMSPLWLEGYLYPDTYIFFTDWNARSALSKMLSQFNTILVPSVREELSNIDYSLHEILTIASLIQMEAATVSEMRVISSVIHNRLKSRDFPYLQIDATSVYLMGKENVNSPEDVLEGQKIDNPYNTYMYEGLPPGPICSPGLEAFRAAIYPAKTNYHFYALGHDDNCRRTGDGCCRGYHRFFNNSSGFNDFRRGSIFRSW